MLGVLYIKIPFYYLESFQVPTEDSAELDVIQLG
jgi:hypothetical protein